MACSSAILPLFALLAGCAVRCPPAAVALPVPPAPVLPVVTEAEARPIPQPVWEKIALRDRLLRNSLDECIATLRATQQAPP